AVVDVTSDDLSGGVDALRESAHDGQRVVERGVGVDWHEAGSSVWSRLQRAPRREPNSRLALASGARCSLARRGLAGGHIDRGHEFAPTVLCSFVMPSAARAVPNSGTHNAFHLDPNPEATTQLIVAPRRRRIAAAYRRAAVMRAARS